ncbi:MAG: hypothetical protein AAF515_05155 [Pseudomonadota bacterium]
MVDRMSTADYRKRFKVTGDAFATVTQAELARMLKGQPQQPKSVAGGGKRTKTKADYERDFELQLKGRGFRVVSDRRGLDKSADVWREFCFALDAHDRKYRFDFAFPNAQLWLDDRPIDLRLAVEIEGLVNQGPGSDRRSRHQTITGFTNDCRKYAMANECGWLPLRVPQSFIGSGEALALVERWLRWNPYPPKGKRQESEQ